MLQKFGIKQFGQNLQSGVTIIIKNILTDV